VEVRAFKINKPEPVELRRSETFNVTEECLPFLSREDDQIK
jgi:hypothetical protein